MPAIRAPRREAAEGEQWRTALVACSLTGQGLAGRTAQWREVLDGAVSEPVPDSVRLTLPVDRAGAVAALAASEHECCPFFDFLLHLDGTSLRLDVRARSISGRWPPAVAREGRRPVRGRDWSMQSTQRFRHPFSHAWLNRAVRGA